MYSIWFPCYFSFLVFSYPGAYINEQGMHCSTIHPLKPDLCGRTDLFLLHTYVPHKTGCATNVLCR